MLVQISVVVIALSAAAAGASIVAVIAALFIRHALLATKAQSKEAVPSSSLENEPQVQVRREYMMSYISTNANSSMPESELVGSTTEYGTLLFVTINCSYKLQVLLTILAQRHQTNKFVVLSITELQPGALDGTPSNELFVIQPSPQTV
jgi:hypothetical protein